MQNKHVYREDNHETDPDRPSPENWQTNIKTIKQGTVETNLFLYIPSKKNLNRYL